jgi:hypothetical protein
VIWRQHHAATIAVREQFKQLLLFTNRPVAVPRTERETVSLAQREVFCDAIVEVLDQGLRGDGGCRIDHHAECGSTIHDARDEPIDGLAEGDEIDMDRVTRKERSRQARTPERDRTSNAHQARLRLHGVDALRRPGPRAFGDAVNRFIDLACQAGRWSTIRRSAQPLEKKVCRYVKGRISSNLVQIRGNDGSFSYQ